MKSKFMYNTERGISVLPILFIVMAIAVAGGIGYAISTQTDLFLSRGDNTNIVGCTLEAKLCPDGSSVGRTGPNCAFADCPTTNVNTTVNTNSTTNTNTAASLTDDWKTYTNSTIGYSMKYPANWKVSTCGYGAVWLGTQGVLCGSDAPTSDVIVDQMAKGTDLNTTLTNEKKDMIDPVQTTVTVGGVQATRLTGTTKKDENSFYGGGLFRDYVYVLHAGYYYRIGYFTTTGVKVHDDVFSTLLSTFAFTK